MKAILLLAPILISNLLSMDFENFKQKALENSSTLKNAKLSIEVSKQHAKILERYENPSLSLQGGRFDSGSVDDGWSVGLSQAIRLPNVGSDLRDLAKAGEEEAETTLLYTKALFTKNLEKHYHNYVYQSSLTSLIKEELKLASRLENITRIRLKNGQGTKAQGMMATLEKEDVKNRLQTQKNRVSMHYLALLSYANITDEPSLEAKFIYPLHVQVEKESKSNPRLLKTSAKQHRLEKEVKVQEHSIKSVELFGEFENEPDQEIQRLGVALHLPLFNANREEARIAKIRNKQGLLRLEALQREEVLKIKSLKKTLSHLHSQHIALEKQHIKQQKLLRLFEEGYRISKGSLLELISVKNSVIQKRKQLLQIQKEANLNTSELNFIQGRYND